MERKERTVSEKNPQQPTGRCPEVNSLDRAGIAFSTGQAARYCFVTGDTILNWINQGSLSAQKTPGGQYRILPGALYTFMREHDMSTALLEAELDVMPLCWEFNCRRHSALGCQGCLVHRSGAARCFELRDLLPDSPARPASCDECDYYRRHSRTGG